MPFTIGESTLGGPDGFGSPAAPTSAPIAPFTLGSSTLGGPAVLGGGSTSSPVVMPPATTPLNLSGVAVITVTSIGALTLDSPSILHLSGISVIVVDAVPAAIVYGLELHGLDSSSIGEIVQQSRLSLLVAADPGTGTLVIDAVSGAISHDGGDGGPDDPHPARGYGYWHQVSETYPEPVLNAYGSPMNWQPTNITTGEWGRFMIVVNHKDVTFFRGVATVMNTLVTSEPFGPISFQLDFPQISPYEVLGQPGTDLSWWNDFAPVDIYHIDSNGVIDYSNPLFEGIMMSNEDTVSSSAGTASMQGVGALYELNYLLAPPDFNLEYQDMAAGILFSSNTGINTKITNRDVRYLAKGGISPLWSARQRLTGVGNAYTGSWNSLLTGYYQDILAMSVVANRFGLGARTIGISNRGDDGGYWIAADDSSVVTFGRNTPYWGSEGNLPLDAPMSGFASRPDGRGYWQCTQLGEVYTFGYAQDHGGTNQSDKSIVAMASTASGDGYYIVSSTGTVWAFGDAVHHGNASGHTITAIATTDGSGYWLLAEDGQTVNFGDAVYNNSSPSDYTSDDDSTNYVGIARAPGTGGGYWIVSKLGYVHAYYGAMDYGSSLGQPDPFKSITACINGDGYWLVTVWGHIAGHGSALGNSFGGVPDGEGQFEQWTLMVQGGRKPVIQMKNQWDTHWTVHAGGRGIGHTLSRDLSVAPNVVYGEGVDLNNNSWRNTKYPALLNGQPPVFDNVLITIGSSTAMAQRWMQGMYEQGHTAMATSDGVVSSIFTAAISDQCLQFQKDAGIAQTGNVDATTWNATFYSGSYDGSLHDAFYAPLASTPTIEKYLYSPSGVITGPNPYFDYTQRRIEQYTNYGAGITKEQGVATARSDIGKNVYKQWAGTITLDADPVEGHRFGIHAGQNILLRYFKGRDILFHISSCSIDGKTGQVQLKVAENAIDAIELEAIWNRDYLANDMTHRIHLLRQSRSSTTVQDTFPTWDSESGAGIIPTIALGAGVWSVIRLPFGQIGDVVRTEAYLNAAYGFSMCLFDYPVTPLHLQGLIPNPCTYEPDGTTSPWDLFPDDLGLIVAWGSPSNPCGYYTPIKPGANAFSVSAGSEGQPVTGAFVETSSFQWDSTTPPWVYLGLWAPHDCQLHGRFYPGVNTQSMNR